MLSCPTCGAPVAKAIAFNNNASEFWYECTRCNTFINTYKPMPHQQAVHDDPHRTVLNAGGFGTGKTTASRQEVYRHALLTPNANILIGAKVTTQYEQTIKREIEADIPKAFIKDHSVQKSYMTLINNARVMYRPLDDPDKLRSYNLSMWVIVEASETSSEAYHQLKTRLRNMNAVSKDKQFDWRRGIIETNPSAGWVRSDVLLNAASVTTHGTVIDRYEPSLTPDPSISVHITSTDANTYLPHNFIEEISKNKPSWWVAKFVYGSFMYSEGLVYPAASRCFIEPFNIPDHWLRLVSCDYGLSDKFTYTSAAIDQENGIIYIYKNKATNEKSVEELSKIFFEFTEDIPVGGFYTQPLLDPKSGSKRDYMKKSLFTHFMDYGIYFKPGQISVDARVYRLNTYLESGRLKIFNNLDELTTELLDYKFPERTLDATGKNMDKPVDKNNHSINGLEWIVMELPHDPKQLRLGAYDARGRRMTAEALEKQRNIEDASWQLADDSDNGMYNAFDLYQGNTGGESPWMF